MQHGTAIKLFSASQLKKTPTKQITHYKQTNKQHTSFKKQIEKLQSRGTKSTLSCTFQSQAENREKLPILRKI